MGLFVINALDGDGIEYFDHGFVPDYENGPRNGNPDLPKKAANIALILRRSGKDGVSRCGCSTLVQRLEKSCAIRKYAAIVRQY
jgi:hypothetical protein